ncbi:uncharacterized protein [Rhodnius prolixus]|uniref:uncharacterized protein n=1 Tax=Rhodnius prolixus TaxID=13249 RepID=UPI003D1888F9
MQLFLVAVLFGVVQGYSIYRPSKYRSHRQAGGQSQEQGQSQSQGPISFFNQTVPGSEVVGNFPGAQGAVGEFQNVINQGPQGFPGGNQIPYPNIPGNPIPFGQNQQQGQSQGQRFPDFSRGGELQSTSPVPIVSYEFVPNADGSYKYSYETGDGVKKTEEGSQKAVGEPPELGTVVKGSYSYKDPEGNEYTVSYVADENGFQPTGKHLPAAPPLPKEIREAIEKNAAEEAAQNGGFVSPAYHYYLRNNYRYY